MNNLIVPKSAIVVYQHGDSELSVIRDEGTVWATVKAISAYFGITERAVQMHVVNYFEARKGKEKVAKKTFVSSSDASQPVYSYNLDVITYIGFRANHTEQTIAFQDWAAEIVRQYVMGELRTVERTVYQNVRDCIALSDDYDPASDVCRNYFATIQNKLYFAITGQTAAEILAARANAKRPNMGLQAWDHDNIRKADVVIAKNYLSAEEITALEHLDKVILNGADLVLREIRRGKVVTMADWCQSVDMYIIASRMAVLQSKGQITSDRAKAIATKQYVTFCKQLNAAGK